MTMIIDSPQSLFHLMLGTKADREVKLSCAFAACFAHSAAFRRAALQSLWHTCRLPPPCPYRSAWHCGTEVHIPHGRLDLELISSVPQLPVFRLENKLKAPLTSDQLLRYRRADPSTYVVAITKDRPKVDAGWLRANGCFALRWQEIHRALSIPSRARRVDRFLCDSFCQYLEEQSMAYREDLSVKDLGLVRKFFQMVASGARSAQMKAQYALDASSSCLYLLNEILRDSLEIEPSFRKWHRWGPSYYKWNEEDGSEYHYLAFSFHRRAWKEWVGAGVEFPSVQSEPIVWIMQHGDRSKDWSHRHALRTICRKGGLLDKDKMVKLFLADLQKAGVLSQGRRSNRKSA